MKYHKAIFVHLAFIVLGTVLVIWISFYLNRTVLHPRSEVMPFYSWEFVIPAVFTGGVVSVLWLYFLVVHLLQPMKQVTKFTVQLTENEPIVRRHQTMDHRHFPLLTSAIEQLSEKMQKDQHSFARMERVRSEFLGNVSHELRTPIFALQGFIETLLGGAVDDPEVNRKFLERSLHQTTRLNDLLSDLIEISRIESGDMKLSLRYFDIHEFLAQFTSEMQPVAQQQNVALHYVVDSQPSDALVLGDKKRLKQVFENLVENAVKYNVEGGSVQVHLSLQKNAAIISVVDSGIGIPEEHRARVFERFYRVDKDRSRAIGGTGLGLAIVKHIVLAHKGKVEVKETSGGGSTFTVTLNR